MEKICPNCNYPNSLDAFFCSECQEDISQIKPIETHTPHTYNMPNRTNTNKYMSMTYDDLSIGAWVGILIGLSIPLINFIVLIVIIMSAGNKTLKNFAIAHFILMGVMITMSLVLALCL